MSLLEVIAKFDTTVSHIDVNITVCSLCLTRLPISNYVNSVYNYY